MTDFFDNEMMLSDVIDTDGEFIPLFTSEDEENMSKEEIPLELPILPLRNNVLFPGVVIPITVGRDKSIRLIQDANKGDKVIGVVAQRDQNQDEPEIEGLHEIGTVARIIKLLRMPDGSTTIIIQGKQRFKVVEYVSVDPYFKASVKALEEPKSESSDNTVALISSLKEMSLNIIKQSPNIPSEAGFAINNIDSLSFLVNFISSNMNAEIAEKQAILEEIDTEERAKRVMMHLNKEMQLLQIKNDIQSKVRTDIDKQQREYFLYQQMRQIQDELGDNPVTQEVNDLKARAEKKKWNKTVEKAFFKELDKLQRLNPQAAEYSVQLNYLELLVELPWGEHSKDRMDIKRAKKILDRDHHGLEKVKERILEQLAVIKLKGDFRKAPILCFYGPPGVGKTSLGKSIAEALGRKYIRMSLGGMRDEAEIRGHRKTYIGAMPGRIIQSIKKAGTANPVFILDEIDKLNQSGHGDPSSALLEVLDPEQNTAFYDNYVEQDFDLSRVMFIATANSLSSIQPALRDRMDIIEVNGYTLEEKIQIAQKHLINKHLEDTGVPKSKCKFTVDILERIIESYTNESGVRTLEKRISKMVRHRAKQMALGETFEAEIQVSDLRVALGPSHAKDKYQGNEFAGVVTGLAWTPTGGDILYIETSLTKGKGQLTLTGNLGDVMKESATLALQYLKAHASLIDIDPDVFEKWNVHVHVPEGATPKDGPSAGITMLSAIASAFTQRKIRSHLAMTGEITLRGLVLPVGGIKEKILAAKRAGITTIMMSRQNQKDVEDIKVEYLSGLAFHYVDTMREVLQFALLDEKVSEPLVIN
ncbi:MAG TPA: endopeptidase La [Luteibaculaceae bacterium]|nr:endopeptidase La [Luteibaculaceae bacterium]